MDCVPKPIQFCHHLRFLFFQIFIGIPKLQQRREILETVTKDIKISDDVDFGDLASSTPGYTGADLASLVQHAVYNAGSGHGFQQVNHHSISCFI